LAAEPVPLNLARPLHSDADGRARLLLASTDEVLIRHGRHFEVDVDPVEQRPRHPGAVPLDVDGTATAGTGGITEIAAGAGVHRRREHHASGIGEAGGRPAQGDGAVFEGLAQHLQDVAPELRQLVEEEDSAVRKADLAGPG
jgi:hypothetical protein